MKAIELILPPNAKFHLGEYTEDQDTALFNTSQIIHSDVLFGAFISSLVQINPQKLENFKKYFEENILSISSAFYSVKINDKEKVYLLPKPISLNLFQPKDIENFQVKKFKKIEFISKGVWEQGIHPEHWFKDNSECVMPNNKTICLRSEIGNEKFELFTLCDEEKVELTRLDEDNNLYTRTSIEILKTENTSVSFFFLIEYDKLPEEDKKILNSTLELMVINGIGGERHTGSGAISDMREVDFNINVIEKSDKKVALGLIFPQDLKKYTYYQTKVRGGMNFGNNKRIKLLTAIQEGAIINDEESAHIIDMSQNGRKYWKYSSSICLPLHKNYDLE